jgi:hypothetical protein
MTIELMLRAVAFAMVCAIIGYILFALIMYAIALAQIGSWIFVLTAGGLPGG